MLLHMCKTAKNWLATRIAVCVCVFVCARMSRRYCIFWGLYLDSL